MLSRSLISASLSLCLVLALPASAEKLMVSGVSQISHFDTLTLQANGTLASSGLFPARVLDNGKVELGTGFKASALAGAKLIYQGKAVAKINGQGGHVVTLAGMPVGPKWLPHLINPPPKQGFQVATMNDQIMNGETTVGPVTSGMGMADVRLKSVKLQINFQDFTPGKTLTIPNKPVRVQWDYVWDCPNGKHAGTVRFVGEVLGQRIEESREYTPPGDAAWWNRISYTPSKLGPVKVNFKFKLKADGDMKPGNDHAQIEGMLLVVDK